MTKLINALVIAIVVNCTAVFAQSSELQVFDIADIAKATIEGLLDKKCLNYCATGLCVSIDCSSGFCLPDSSLRVRHRLPDLVVTTWNGDKAAVREWQRIIQKLAKSFDIASGLSYGRPNTINRNAVFKEALIFGNPADFPLGDLRPICKQLTKPLSPYMSSHIDHKVWRNSKIEGALAIGKFATLINGPGDRRWSKLYPRIGYSRTYSSSIANYITAQRAVNLAESSPQHFLSANGIPAFEARHQTQRTAHTFEHRLANACWQAIDGSINATPSDDKCEPVNPDLMILDHFQPSFTALLWTDYECCLPIDGKIVKIIDLPKPICYD